MHMQSPLSIVMYHYVRDLEHSRYPGIKGLPLDLFVEQLDYLQRHYVVTRPEDVIAAAKSNGDSLPRNAIVLTFDDGYRDHYDNVFPVLFERGLSAMFFPPVKAVANHQLLDVNKIHFILASVEDPARLLPDLFETLDEHRAQYGLESNEAYYQRLAVANRFDPPEVIFIKRLLQHELPEHPRNAITQHLFERFVGVAEATLAQELYVSEEQLKVMIGCGMYVGSHGADHLWLDRVDPEQQARDVDESLAFLARLGAPVDDWVMSYPYGAYNDTLLDILRARKCAMGLTTEVAIADLGTHDPLLLPRLDTNDLPKSRTAEPNEWFQKIAA